MQYTHQVLKHFFAQGLQESANIALLHNFCHPTQTNLNELLCISMHHPTAHTRSQYTSVNITSNLVYTKQRGLTLLCLYITC